MSRNDDRMLVSMLLLGFNQARYIRQAVEGAFAQTYSPLEIILSDDGSQDQTFQIMREMAASYHGPHKVILNQNPVNLGPGGNLNRCIELSNGKWLVKADGDDISLPERIEKIMELLANEGDHRHLIYTGNTWISNDGEALRINNRPQHGDLDLEKDFLLADTYVLGATCSWSRACATRFGPIDDTLHDDHVFPFRAKLLGSVAFLPRPLVNYRIYAGSTVAALQKPLALLPLGGFRSALRINVSGLLRRLTIEYRIIQQKINDLTQIDAPAEHIAILSQRARIVAAQTTCLSDQSFYRSFSALICAEGGRMVALKSLFKGRLLRMLETFQK